MYDNVSPSILPNLCTDVIVRNDLLARHSKLKMYHDESEWPPAVSCLATAKVKQVSLLAHLTVDFRPILSNLILILRLTLNLSPIKYLAF